jgi:hypothetical protein
MQMVYHIAIRWREPFTLIDLSALCGVSRRSLQLEGARTEESAEESQGTQKYWNAALESGTITETSCLFPPRKHALKGGLMLATRHRLPRNPLFQFHPMHTLFSVLGALILFGLLIWFMAVPAR